MKNFTLTLLTLTFLGFTATAQIAKTNTQNFVSPTSQVSTVETSSTVSKNLTVAIAPIQAKGMIKVANNTLSNNATPAVPTKLLKEGKVKVAFETENEPVQIRVVGAAAWWDYTKLTC